MLREQVTVLVVDDSSFMRKVITDLLEEDPKIKVIGTAIHGRDALEKMELLEPDVITLDIEMPVMDGLTALRRIMQEKPTPVIMLSNHTQIGADATIAALEMGAVDFVAKPSGNISLDLDKVQDELLIKVKIAGAAKKLALPLQPAAHRSKVSKANSDNQNLNSVVVIGASTGGPRALHSLLTRIDAKLEAAIIIAQHMPAGFTKSLANRLNEICALPVKEAQQGETLEPGKVYLAPGDYHLRVKESAAGFCFGLRKNNSGSILCPSVDVLMTSVAPLNLRKIGIVLTGMGDDGTAGLKLIKAAGGITVAEDKSTCIIYGMPRAALEAGCVDYVEPISKIGPLINEMVK